MKNLAGKVVLINGAGRGSGRALAEAYAAQGARVAANDFSPVGLDETLARIIARGGQGHTYEFDAARLLPTQALVQQVLDDFGQIDGLVNAAAVMPADKLLDMDEWDFHRTLDINLAGAFLLMQRVGRIMQQQGAGWIVNIGGPQAPGSAYQASQAALEALSRSAHEELAGFGIQVRYVADYTALIEEISA